ncbi:hypothetical protein [Rhizobium etli]|uniref:hypothetical protein n=1 Tax=Rhizobium etli TaxID=29449 RepID=UPI00059EF91A|nr:hypothetical protein [Rhizobium etli]
MKFFEGAGVIVDQFEEYFDDEQRDRILEIARALNFAGNRSALMSSLPKGYTSTMDKLQNDDAQLVADIDNLRRRLDVRHSKKGLISPFAIWLRRGAELNPDLPEVDELRAFAQAAEVTFAKYSPLDQKARNGRIEDTVRKTLRLFYLPFLTDHLVSESQPVKELASHLEDAIKKQFKYNEKVFVKDLRRKLTVSWQDKGRKTIKVADRSTFEFVPFTHENIIWKAQRFATGELATDDYDALVDEVLLDEVPVTGAEVRESNGQIVTTTYQIDVTTRGPPFLMKARRDFCWELDSDPMYEQSSPYVVQNCLLEIENQAEGLRLVFHDVGGTDLFSPERLAPGDHKWDVIPYNESRVLSAVPVLLPGQGCILVMSRTLDGLDV